MSSASRNEGTRWRIPDQARARWTRGDALVDYVHAVHESYVAAITRRTTSTRRRCRSAGSPFGVAVVAASQLHVIATRDLSSRPPPARGAGRRRGVAPPSWQVRFLDVVGASPELVLDRGRDGHRRPATILGISTTLYHLTVDDVRGADGHQAMHAGAGLAHAHLTSEGAMTRRAGRCRRWATPPAAQAVLVERARARGHGAGGAARLGKSTVHRLLATLQEEQLRRAGPESGRYRLGLAIFELGAAASTSTTCTRPS
jgi:hypothetical protein